jgi:hypothetical protein
MKILELLKNPIIKTIGIVAILYFALFADKKNPESLGNRLSPEKIKQDFSEITEKSKFIITNVQLAKDAMKEQQSQQISDVTLAEISIEDLDLGEGEESLSCGSEAEIIYGIYTGDGRQLEFSKPEKIVIGSRKDYLIEKNIIGMKKSGIRAIKVPQKFQTGDKKLYELLKFNQTDLKYQVTLLSFVSNVDPTASCE